MTARLPRPSRKLDAHRFYHEYVPQLWSALVGGLSDTPWRVQVGAQLGEDAFSMVAEGTELVVSDGLPDRPHITFVSDSDSFRIAMFDLLPQILRHTEKQLGSGDSAPHVKNYGDAIRPDRLYSVPGRIRIDYEDDAGDRAKVDIVVADGSGPSVQVSATDADLWAFLGGGAALSQLVRTRVRIDGDVAYLLSVVSIIEP